MRVRMRVGQTNSQGVAGRVDRSAVRHVQFRHGPAQPQRVAEIHPAREKSERQGVVVQLSRLGLDLYRQREPQNWTCRNCAGSL